MTATALGSPAIALPSLPELLRLRAAEQPERVAYTFLRDGEIPDLSFTYAELDAAARSRAAALAAAGLTGGTAVLLYPSGLEFVAALFGCMAARVAGAPVQVPSRRRGLERLRRIADDAGATTVLTTGAVKRDLEERFGDSPELSGLTLLPTDEVPHRDPDDSTPPSPDDVALLQYTSGSTGDPKGVRVTHANFQANVAETDLLWPLAPDGTIVNWLPLFHDMGMLFGVIAPLWAGVPAVLMSPEAFIRRPARWLEAISRFHGTHAAAPSFAYELCVRAVAADPGTLDGLDLSHWRVAANGAEPVRWSTMDAFITTFAPAGFRAAAMCPGYGLAENTLKATGSPGHRAPAVLRLDPEALRGGQARPGGTPVVGSGVPVGDTRIAIVDPERGDVRPDDTVGEIWISGPCVADGYHGRPVESAATFAARTADAGRTWLRTGDLGFLHDGELFVTGRLKDVIIRQGRNYYPQDIELSAERADPGLRPNCAAAFSADDGETERLVLVVEVDGRTLRIGADLLRDRIHASVHDGHRLTADEILLVRRGALPKTSSGKVQRRETRRRYLDGEFG
ncbi:fatty acyl-AMP ligase [Catenuloplanes sp. NPDC051500]|uniref:fatty acyl-AMP ligase n=1 Tax=Catenuloplanes sp. NPDC051500 TaxID=3363959 RepID=UPI0037BB06BD